MATKPYIKLDWDWAECPEAEMLRNRHGNKALLGWIQLMILMSEFDGALDLDDEMQMKRAMKRMRRNETQVLQLVSWCAECGLVDPEYLSRAHRASSPRAQRDARAREGRREYAKARAAAANSGENARSGYCTSSGKPGGMVPLSRLLR